MGEGKMWDAFAESRALMLEFWQANPDTWFLQSDLQSRKLPGTECVASPDRRTRELKGLGWVLLNEPKHPVTGVKASWWMFPADQTPPPRSPLPFDSVWGDEE